MTQVFANEHAGLIGLLFFFIFFCAVTAWTFRPGARKHYDNIGRIPLEETER